MRASGLPQRRKHLFPVARSLLFLGAASTAVLLLFVSCSSVDPSAELLVYSNAADGTLVDMEWSANPPLSKPGELPRMVEVDHAKVELAKREENVMEAVERSRGGASCATVEEMGETFAAGSETESLRIRDLIHRHFSLHGAARVRGLPPDQFCQGGFVLGKASEAGFGNEMYKILSAAALSVMLNRSLIIGQTRGFYPFGDFISYTNHSFTLKEVKHLWRKNDCAGKYRRKLLIRLDNFESPAETNILCSDWRIWKQPIIWLQGTTDAVAIQFFLKNVNPGMKNAASILFGDTRLLKSRPNVFGELLRFIVAPSEAILEAINWVLKGKDPEIALHMRMLTNRSARAVKAALICVKRAVHNLDPRIANPRVVLVSDTPSFIKEITPNLTEFADVLYFDYKLFKSSISSWRMDKKEQGAPRMKDTTIGVAVTNAMRMRVFYTSSELNSSKSRLIVLASDAALTPLGAVYSPLTSPHMSSATYYAHCWHSAFMGIIAGTQFFRELGVTSLLVSYRLRGASYRVSSGYQRPGDGNDTDFRVRDWGPAPRWVAFVDFFLASRAKYAVVSGAHRRVGTTYAQLIAALATANHHGEHQMNSSFVFYSSFQSNLLVDGLAKQTGWGHVWNRFAGPLSCRHQPNQCTITPLLPPAWWDGDWQSPIPRDVRRLEAYGVQLTKNGRVVDSSLESYCKRREDHVRTIHVFGSCSGTKCK
ncbi:hypothetical protein IEQ34_007201 [Dendrobium chrysotoxum]|uniref:Uncharacterized protein n=1 Tax=Dendrobium chrysotoxum TaxID=161865 RepID=A0AAV7GRF4_DENCH|nr:hypothetical protein IEQ34_007201 [Dendrobium chrysotoxum]